MKFPDATVTGNSTPPRTGAFEVKIDGKEVYSKFKTGSFPDKDKVLSWFK